MYVIFFYSIYVLPLPYIQGVWQSNATFSLPLYFKNPSHGLYFYQVGPIPSLRRDETRFFYPLSKKIMFIRALAPSKTALALAPLQKQLL
jgi:hypothetical protein